MGLREFIAKRLGYWGKEEKGGSFILSQWGQAPERDTKGCLSAYGNVYSLFGIVQRIACAVAEVKWKLYRGDERSERSQVSQHPILDLLDKVNDFQTGTELMELHSIYSDLTGKVFWYLPRNKIGVPGEIWILPSHQMTIIPSKEKFISGYVFNSGNEHIPFDTNEIIWFSMPDPLNPTGSVGFAQAAAVEISSEDYAGRWNRNFFFNSARADAVIECERNLNEDDFEKLKLQWNSEHRGLGAAHKVAILQGGLKYKQTQIMPRDMDFYQLRKRTLENLLFTFGMPLSVMGVSENVNKANAEAGDYTFAKWLIKPRLTRIKNKLNEQLLPMFPNTKGMEIDFDEVVPETTDQKKSLAESGLRSGAMTINESRKLYGLDPLPNGDVLLVPLNMIPTPIKDMGKPQEEPPKNPNETPEETSEEIPEETPPEKAIKRGLDEPRKEAIWNIYINKALSYERLIIKNLQDMFSKQEKESLGNIGNERLFDKEEARKDFKGSVESPLSKLIQEAYEDAENLLNPVNPHKAYEFNEKQIGLIAALEWLKSRIGWAADEVGDETERLLSEQLRQGYELGEDAKKLAKRVESVFDFCSKSRAETIARTETIMASNQGAIEGYKEVGVEKLEFYTAQDERTCEDCESLNREEFDIGDSVGVIPVHPNCRCVFTPVIK